MNGTAKQPRRTEISRNLEQYPMAQRIELWPIDKLIPYARNPRTHSDAQIAQIAASITEFGFNPILVGAKSGIIAGHEPARSRRICGS
jgi:hypothetical protein